VSGQRGRPEGKNKLPAKGTYGTPRSRGALKDWRRRFRGGHVLMERESQDIGTRSGEKMGDGSAGDTKGERAVCSGLRGGGGSKNYRERFLRLITYWYRIE